jgi:hypothetical protein
MIKLSFKQKRTTAGVFLCIAVFCIINILFEFNFFGKYGRLVEILSFVTLALVMGYLGPTSQEIRDYRAQKRSRWS